MLLPLAVYGGGEKVVNIPTPHTVELPPCVMTCDLVHYYLNEPVGDKHGEEFLVSTDRTLSHLTSGLLTRGIYSSNGTGFFPPIRYPGYQFSSPILFPV